MVTDLNYPPTIYILYMYCITLWQVLLNYILVLYKYYTIEPHNVLFYILTNRTMRKQGVYRLKIKRYKIVLHCFIYFTFILHLFYFYYNSFFFCNNAIVILLYLYICKTQRVHDLFINFYLFIALCLLSDHVRYFKPFFIHSVIIFILNLIFTQCKCH